MKQSLVFMAGVLFLLAARPANAGLFTNTSLCWAGSGTYTTAFDSCVYTGSAYVDTPNPGGGNGQIFDGSATAVAEPNEWKVAVNLMLTDYRRDMYIWYTDDPSNPGQATIATTAFAGAGLNDTVTVTGGTGVYSLSYIFSLDGSLTSSDAGILFQPEFCAALSIPQGSGTQASTCLSYNSSVPSTFTLTYADLPFGGPIDPTLEIFADGLVEPIYSSDVASIGADAISGNLAAEFGSTVTLTSLLITDSNGNPIPGVQIQSAAGIDYPLSPANSAPEPGSLAAFGLLLLGGLRRFRGSLSGGAAPGRPN